MKKIGALGVVALALAGCATPPGQLAESDFAWSAIHVGANPRQVFRIVMERYRNCGGDVIPDGQYYEDSTLNRVDLYLRAGFTGARGNFVFGVVEVGAAGARGGSNVRVGVQRMYDSPVFGRPGQKRRAIVDALNSPQLPCDYETL
jgi:hypothetical protein